MLFLESLFLWGLDTNTAADAAKLRTNTYRILPPHSASVNRTACQQSYASFQHIALGPCSLAILIYNLPMRPAFVI